MVNRFLTFENDNYSGHIGIRHSRGTIGNATLGGLTFGELDLVDYDPVADTATLLFGGASFSNAAEDVDAAFINGYSTLTGSAGDDWLNGGDGPDTLSGGSGSDVFAFGAGDSGVDQITDFDVASDANADNDSLDISDLLTVDPTDDPVATYVSITDTGTEAVVSFRLFVKYAPDISIGHIC